MEQNPDQVRYWLKEKYPAISRQAAAEKARIWWGDETGLRSDHQTGTTWGEKGQTPVVKKSGKRFGCNMISRNILILLNMRSISLSFCKYGEHILATFLEETWK